MLRLTTTVTVIDAPPLNGSTHRNAFRIVW